jgi:hypothetical protein
LSQAPIKNRERCGDHRTVGVVIDSRQPDPTHVRDLLLFAARAAQAEEAVDLSIVAHLDVVDALAVTATMVSGHLRALTAGVEPDVRQHVVADVLGGAAARVDDPRAVNAAATVVGATGQGDLAVGAAIARCLSAFTPDELVEAAVALLASSVRVLARCADVDDREIVAWSSDEPGSRHPVLRPSRTMAYCHRPATTELHLHPHT